MALHATLRCDGFRLTLTFPESADTPAARRMPNSGQIAAECSAAGLGLRGTASGFLWKDDIARFVRELEHLPDFPENTAELRPMEGWTRLFLKLDRTDRILVEGHLQNEPTWRLKLDFVGRCDRADVGVFFRELRLIHP